MLWVNLIMDTFAALALASLPPDECVMQDPPRKTTDHIITRPMGRNILGVGILFVVFPVRPAAIFQACGHYQSHAVQPQRLLPQLPGLLHPGT